MGTDTKMKSSCGGSIKLYCSFICLVLYLAVAVSASDNKETFIKHLNKIGENLDKALSTAIDVNNINYTSLYVNVTYKSNAKYNPRGLGELYNITRAFMKLILKEAIPKHIFSVKNNEVQVELNDHWLDLFLQYSFIILICFVVVLLGSIMPVCGVFFCCCRCCGKCGARSRPYDKKHDLCRRFYLATLLIVCGTLLLFGVVCAFVTNQRLEDGIQNLPNDFRKSVQDTDTFLNATNTQIDILLKTNFKEFYTNINSSLDECSTIVFNELEQISNASSMDDISNIARQFPSIRSDYELLKNSTNDLRIYASQLNDGVRRIKRALLDDLRNCVGEIEQCTALNNDIARLQTNVDFDKLPDINYQIKELDEIMENTNVDDILKGEQKLRQIQIDIQKAVKDNTEEAKRRILDAGRKLSSSADNITSHVDKLRNMISEVDTMHNGKQESALDMMQKYITVFDPYRQYVGLAICCILLMITIFVALGLICGICGKRPGGYGDDCCNKGSGSQFLLCGVMFMFFFTCIIAAATLAYFLVGTATQEAACKSLRQPTDSPFFHLIDQINLTRYGLNRNLSSIIDSCHKNETVYVVFDLQKQFDVNQVYKYFQDFDIEKTLNDLNKTTSQIDFHNFVLLNPEQLRTLKKISSSDFANVDFSKFLDELSANFTSVDLNLIKDELNAAIARVSAIAQTDSKAVKLERQLETAKVQLDFYERKVVQPMLATAEKVKVTAASLEKKLLLGHSSFKEAMDDLITKVQLAQNSLRDHGPNMIREAAYNFSQQIIGECKKYIGRVVNNTKDEVGKCGPLSNVYDAILTSSCDKVALQMNGFWFTLLCSMLVFLPTIVISVKLAILYQKQVPFSDYYVETTGPMNGHVDFG
ncbi:hypothetical protein HHI36_014392 [Cryptolaemus montrouzieri]|uniref:Prominin-like protein n=1 Tax=Cryptolaemus montrouzieri TaxID=559131 RepID=A0ABD2N2N8_9CUCU